MDLRYRLLIGISLLKALKTLRYYIKKALLVSPLIKYIFSLIEFNDLSTPSIKARLTSLLPPILTTPLSTPSLSKRRSLVK